MVMRTTRGGKQIDFDALVAKNARKKVIGNTSSNVRGDQLNERGEIIRPADDVLNDNKRVSLGTETVSIADIGFTPERVSPQPVQEDIEPVVEQSDSVKKPKKKTTANKKPKMVENADGDFVPENEVNNS